jgi:hypothetical protein
MKMIEITKEEALLLDGELYKLQIELTRKEWTVDSPPTVNELKRKRTISKLREKIDKAFKMKAVERFVGEQV